MPPAFRVKEIDSFEVEETDIVKAVGACRVQLRN
jgi:hypothetical protein